MKNIILILSSALLLAACGTEPRDPVRLGAAAVGREADRREREQARNDQFIEGLKYQKKRNQLNDNIKKLTERQSHQERLPNRSQWGSFRPAPRR